MLKSLMVDIGSSHYLIISMINGFMLKMFVFQNEVTFQSFPLQLPIPINCEGVEIGQVVEFFKTMNSIKESLDVKVYDPVRNRYIQLESQEITDKTFLYSPIIMIKYKVRDAPEQSLPAEPDSNEVVAEKKERNKERTIRQVIMCVKEWRETHNTLNKSKEKINLQEAAKILGITKKSLDDYYSQLRLAEKYGFDFYNNIDKKVGVLRLFVKNHRQKDRSSLKYDKLPKHLKIIQDFDPARVEEFVKVRAWEEPEETIIDSLPTPSVIVSENEFQKSFYRSFNFMMDDPQNPFWGGRGSKKDREPFDSQQQFLLF